MPWKVRYAVRYVKDVLQQMSQVVAVASPMGELGSRTCWVFSEHMGFFRSKRSSISRVDLALV
jgi:hypothetical protein